MVSVKFGKAKVRVIDEDQPSDAGHDPHIDTPRPHIFSNQELVDANLKKAIVYDPYYIQRLLGFVS